MENESFCDCFFVDFTIVDQILGRAPPLWTWNTLCIKDVYMNTDAWKPFTSCMQLVLMYGYHGLYLWSKNWHLEKFQIPVKNLNKIWSFIDIYAVFVLNLCGENLCWEKMTNMRSDQWSYTLSDALTQVKTRQPKVSSACDSTDPVQAIEPPFYWLNELSVW